MSKKGKKQAIATNRELVARISNDSRNTQRLASCGSSSDGNSSARCTGTGIGSRRNLRGKNQIRTTRQTNKNKTKRRTDGLVREPKVVDVGRIGADSVLGVGETGSDGAVANNEKRTRRVTATSIIRAGSCPQVRAASSSAPRATSSHGIAFFFFSETTRTNKQKDIQTTV